MVNMWKPITGYRYQYRINDQGEVQKLWDSGKWRTLKQWTNRGRQMVDFRRLDGGVDRKAVSKLVATYFMGGVPEGMLCVHKNGMKTDNSKENIVFMTQSQLSKSTRAGNSKPVLKIAPDGEVVAIYRSGFEAARANYISQPYMSKLCLGLVKDPFRLDGYNYVYETQDNRRKKKYDSF